MTSPSERGARPRIIFTIASRNYVSYALTLLRSVEQSDPEARRVLVLADSTEGLENIPIPAEVMPVTALGIPDFEDMATRYTVMELNTAVKPFVFLHFFGTEPDATCIYLDPDILVFARLEAVEAAFRGGAELVLTPHITRPLQDGLQPDDIAIMKSGIWNLGFAAMRRSESTTLLARWWADRCVADCRVDIPGHIFTDQRWMDLAPAFVEHTSFIRHPGYNLAYWNLPHRPVECREGRYLVAGKPLVFVHFSGVVPDAPEVFSKHQSRYAASDIGDLAALLARYQGLLLANGWKETSRLPYAWSRSSSGRRIIDAMRYHYRETFLRPPSSEELQAQGFAGCVADWMDQIPPEAALTPQPHLSRLVWRCWHMRNDLQQVFDIREPAGRRDMLNWFILTAAKEFGVDAQSLAAANLSLENETRRGPEPQQRWPLQRNAAPPSVDERADAFLAAEVPAEFPEGSIVIPRLLALLWETRSDLRDTFPMHTAEDLDAFLDWALDGGVLEGSIDVRLLVNCPGFVDHLLRTSRATPGPGNVLVRAAARAYDEEFGPVPEDLADASEDDLTRVVAFMVSQWPMTGQLPEASLDAAIAWLGEDPDPHDGEPPLPRVARMVFRLREDIRQNYPPDTTMGRLGLLGWYLLAGRFDHGLEHLPIPPRVLQWIEEDDTPTPDGLSNVLRIAHAARHDLRQGIDISTAEGVRVLRAWFEASGREECRGLTLHLPSQGSSDEAPRRHESVLLLGYSAAPSGRGEDARMTARALAAQGIRARLLNRADAVAGDQRLDADVLISHLNAETAVEDHLWLRLNGVRARRHIGYWAWELSEFPLEWNHAFGIYDEIWAATEFARAAFAARSPRPVHLMPMAVELPAPQPGLDRLGFRLPEDRFLFFTSFDFRSFVSRKNPEAAIRAFRSAFPAGNTTAALVVKTLNADHDPDAAQALRDIARGDPGIILMEQTMGREEITALLAACDAFVSLHRSEGFGRGPAEAMLLGKPVVVTAYSGNLDFCHEDNACLVPATLVPVEPGQYPGGEGQVWAEPDESAAAAHMRRLVEDREFTRGIGERAAATIRALYSAEVVGAGYAQRLKELAPETSADPGITADTSSGA